eukprot:3636519-Rhodomonas_salina.1
MMAAHSVPLAAVACGVKTTPCAARPGQPRGPTSETRPGNLGKDTDRPAQRGFNGLHALRAQRGKGAGAPDSGYLKLGPTYPGTS